MTRRTLAGVLCGALLVLGGCGGSAEDAGQVDAAAEPADEGAPPEDSGDDGERPGDPGGEVSEGEGGARPGVPYDQPVFQQIGSPFDDDTRQGLEDQCAEVCTLSYLVDDDPDDPSLTCTISGFSYEPEEEGTFFQSGSVVTVSVGCTPNGITDGATDGAPTDAATSDDGTSGDPAG